MGQITIYLDQELEAIVRKYAKQENISYSRWLAKLIREKTESAWPAEIMALAGVWAQDDFPMAEHLRQDQPNDMVRETL